MRVPSPEGDLRVERLWFPWRRRVRDVPDTGGNWGTDLGDDPISAFLGLVLLVLLLPVLLVSLVVALELLLLVLLVVPFAVARSLFGIPWTVRVRNGEHVLHAERVRGFLASRRRMAELAELARTGQLAYLPSPVPTND